MGGGVRVKTPAIFTLPQILGYIRNNCSLTRLITTLGMCYEH